MRILLTALALSLCLAAPAPVAATGELRGVARAGSRVIADAAIWLDAPSSGPVAVEPEPLLDQRNLQFLPHVLVVRVGTTVRFPNSDRVFHNVFSFHDGKKFDLGVYPIGAVKHVKFDRAGVSRLFCNIHPGMAAYVVAVDSPYFGASDDAGTYVVHAPPGRYTYHAWRAGAAPLTGEVGVGDGIPFDIQWP
jgi:plastocyanin